MLNVAGNHAEATTNIYAAAGGDRLVFEDDGTLRGLIDGGDDPDTLDFAAYTLNEQTGFKLNRYFVTGEARGHVAGRYSGDISAIDFQSIQSVIGGQNRDEFYFYPGGRMDRIEGGGDCDLVSYSPAVTPTRRAHWQRYIASSTESSPTERARFTAVTGGVDNTAFAGIEALPRGATGS